MRVPSLTLNTGTSIPQLGLGTWPLNDDEVEKTIVTATKLGYRHIDTAVKYGNEVGVGRGVRASGIDRADMFITTKLDGAYQGDDRAVEGLASSLVRLNLDYVDLLLIHWPLPSRGLFVSTWRTFERLLEDGKTRAIGVSNFTPVHLDRLMSETHIVPAVNQLQINPRVRREEQTAYNAKQGIITESYSPLGGSGAGLLDSSDLREIGARNGKTTAQIALRWHIQRGLVAIPKSKSPARLAENLDVFDFTLNAADIAAIDQMAVGAKPGIDSDVSGH